MLFGLMEITNQRHKEQEEKRAQKVNITSV